MLMLSLLQGLLQLQSLRTEHLQFQTRSLHLHQGSSLQTCGCSHCFYFLYHVYSCRMEEFPPSGRRNLPHPRPKQTKFEELCKEGTMPKGRPSRSNEYMWLFVLVNTVSKIQYRNAFSGLSHRGDRPVMTCITTVVYDSSCASVKR